MTPDIKEFFGIKTGVWYRYKLGFLYKDKDGQIPLWEIHPFRVIRMFPSGEAIFVTPKGQVGDFHINGPWPDYDGLVKSFEDIFEEIPNAYFPNTEEIKLFAELVSKGLGIHGWVSVGLVSAGFAGIWDMVKEMMDASKPIGEREN